MARKPKSRPRTRKSKRTQRRQTYVYVGKKTRAQIRDFSRFIPSLEKLKGKTRITSEEKAQLTKAKKALRYSTGMRPITEAQAKRLRKRGEGNIIVGKGIRAVRLGNAGTNAKITVKPNGMIVSTNGETYEYHKLTNPTPDRMVDFGREILKRKDVASIYLWTTRGRGAEGFNYIGDEDDEEAEETGLEGSWIGFIRTRFEQYQALQEFTEGIVARIKKKRTKKK